MDDERVVAREYIHLPKTGEHYVAPLGRICDCSGCFRTIPNVEVLCVPCQLRYHGPGGLHGYGGDVADCSIDHEPGVLRQWQEHLRRIHGVACDYPFRTALPEDYE